MASRLTHAAKQKAIVEPEDTGFVREKRTKHRHDPPPPAVPLNAPEAPSRRKKAEGSTQSKGKGVNKEGSKHPPKSRPASTTDFIRPIFGVMKTRTIMLPRWVDFKDPRLFDLFPKLPSVFKAQSWLSFMSPHKLYYPQLTREFYHNLQLVHGTLYTVVKDVVIWLSK